MRTTRRWFTALMVLTAVWTLVIAVGTSAIAQDPAPIVDSGTDITPLIEESTSGSCGDGSCGDGSCDNGSCGGGNCNDGSCGDANYGQQYCDGDSCGNYGCDGSGDCGQWTESYDEYGYGYPAGSGGLSGMLARMMDPCRCRRLEFFGEYLALRARNAEVAYAVAVDGPIAPVLGNGIQISDFGVVAPGESAGYRAGLSYVLNDCSRVVAGFTNYESDDANKISVGAPNVIRSQVTHPLTNNAAADGLQAQADYEINFQLVDLAYHGCLSCSQRNYIEYFLGVRYGQLEQFFHSDISFNGVTDVDTAIQFNGIGPRMGLYGERRVGCVGLHLYGRSEASFLAGTFDASYTHADSFAQTIVDTGWDSARIVSLLETELGFGWTSAGGCFRLTAGYLVAGWFNTVKTDDFIDAVQQNNPNTLSDLLTFDGLVIRASMRF